MGGEAVLMDRRTDGEAGQGPLAQNAADPRVTDSHSPPPSYAASRRRVRASAHGRGLVRAGYERPARVESVHVTAERRALRALLKPSGAHASAPAPAAAPTRGPAGRSSVWLLVQG